MAKQKTKFKKIFVVDTNIILNDVENLFNLSQNGDNLIVIPETVLDELDTKKSLLQEIGYQAREFGRIYNDAEVLSIDRASNKKLTTISSKSIHNGRRMFINVISKRKYDSDNDSSISSNIRNDRKIIEIARDLSLDFANVVFLSLDIMAKHRAMSIGVEIQNVKETDDKPVVLQAELKLEAPETEYSVFDIFSMDVPDTVQHVQITNTDGKPFFYYRTGNIFKLIDEKELVKQEVKPQNMGQKVLMSQMLDEYYDVVISDSPAGCVLPGTSVNVKLTEKYLRSKELRELFGISNLDIRKLKKHGLISSIGKGYQTKYGLSGFTKNNLKVLDISQYELLVLQNDKKFKSKFLHLRYWLTKYNVQEAIKKTKHCRNYAKYFDCDYDSLISIGFNPLNIERTCIIAQQKIIQEYKLPFSNIQKEFWIFRGYSDEEAAILSDESKLKSASNDFAHKNIDTSKLKPASNDFTYKNIDEPESKNNDFTYKNIDITELTFLKENFKDLKIKTPDGFQEIGELYFKSKKQCYSVAFSNGDIIECSEDHLFEMKTGFELTKNINEGDITVDGFEVLGIINIGISDTYDLEVLHPNHRYFSNSISSHNSGKSILALSAAMKLLDTHKDKYDKIVYIRKTVISDSEELGFLKGDLNEKMQGFLAPLFSNLEYIVEKKYANRKTKLTQEELQSKMDDMKNKYQIQFMYEGHLRGSNIRNAVIIWDECQNNNLASAKTILTRVSENCKVLAMGSNRQIDSKYVNKYNSALAYLMQKIGKNTMRVNLTGFKLNKTVRSAIAEWADEF